MRTVSLFLLAACMCFTGANAGLVVYGLLAGSSAHVVALNTAGGVVAAMGFWQLSRSMSKAE
jgi:hypothetical protein